MLIIIVLGRRVECCPKWVRLSKMKGSLMSASSSTQYAYPHSEIFDLALPVRSLQTDQEPFVVEAPISAMIKINSERNFAGMR